MPQHHWHVRILRARDGTGADGAGFQRGRPRRAPVIRRTLLGRVSLSGAMSGQQGGSRQATDVTVKLQKHRRQATERLKPAPRRPARPDDINRQLNWPGNTGHWYSIVHSTSTRLLGSTVQPIKRISRSHGIVKSAQGFTVLMTEMADQRAPKHIAVLADFQDLLIGDFGFHLGTF